MNRCTLLDWAGNEDVVVAEGRCKSRDPKALVNGLPLGPNAMKVFVDEVLHPETFLWRPTSEMQNVKEALKSFIAWPAHKVVFDTTKDASAREKSPMVKSKALSPLRKSQEAGRCRGRWASDNPEDKVHCQPLGHNAVKVWVEVVKVKDAAVWRPSSEIECMADALGSPIAWPEDKVILC